MFEFIEGKIEDLNPSFAILNNAGIGYFLNISLPTYSKLEKGKNFRLLLHEIIKEDAHDLFAFFEHGERDLFRYLISVSGVGANTARMMLSSANPSELESAIISGNVNSLKSIKGIGLKTAQRIIVELKDKVGKVKTDENMNFLADSQLKNEATSALLTLGFPKSKVEKVLDKIIRENPELSVENVIKFALKNL
jgi:Holliday junction DNA helicase RuvA